MISRTRNESKKLINANRLNDIEKKFNGEEIQKKEFVTVRIPWFCPKCNKRMRNLDDWYYLTRDQCMDCSIIEDEIINER